MLTGILLVFAFVLFAIAATNLVGDPPRTRIIAAGLACLALAQALAAFGVKIP